MEKVLAVLLLSLNVVPAGAADPAGKQEGVFFPAGLVANARANAERYRWASEIRNNLLRAARPWMQMSRDELWDLVFGPTIPRSWMVWSSGHCPACKKGVPMYNWKIDAMGMPWKVRCPRCDEAFPKNDFQAFYRSGLDSRGVFDPGRADRSLLFNREHPDPADPLHRFGVDDGNGYVEGQNRWRFIGAYLIYGQWKQAIVGGIRALADGYIVTGDAEHARRAGILLDRVADLYPTFDFGKQGILYERRGDRGYISTWHDACEEVRQMALAYDQVFEALREDRDLVDFLSARASQHGLANGKASFSDIQRNIEDRIFRDTLRNRRKIESNYPRTDVALATIRAVLNWPGNRAEVNFLLDGIIARATAVDGVTGEKGMAGYSAIGPRSLATLLGRFARLEPEFLNDTFTRHPRLHETFRFHIDMWCLETYYPLSGDTGHFAGRIERYVGVSFARHGSLEPSGFTFLWNLYRLTRDPAFVQILYRANGESVEGLPHDILADDPEGLQRGVAEVIRREGIRLKQGSVNKEEWRIAILRSGEGERERCVWLDYDSGGAHGHADGMNLGIFSRGLDLMPDLGYPPVQFGGWKGPRFNWYTTTASHNTVVVDGKRQATGKGRSTLWAVGKRFQAIRASAPDLIGGQQFERTVILVDVSEDEFYIGDIFRVVGGSDHAKFIHSHFGTMTTEGLSPGPEEPYGQGTQMRNFRGDPSPRPGWSADWKIEDRYGYLPSGSEVHLRHTDFTAGARAITAEGWIVAGIFNSTSETWIPRILVRRRAEDLKEPPAPGAPLASTFVAVIEPYEKRPSIEAVRRLPLETPSGSKYGDNAVALEIRLAAGGTDLLVARDVEDPLRRNPPGRTVMVQGSRGLELRGELCMIRWDREGRPRRIALCRGTSITAGNLRLILKRAVEFLELRLDGSGAATVVSGNPGDIQEVVVQ